MTDHVAAAGLEEEDKETMNEPECHNFVFLIAKLCATYL